MIKKTKKKLKFLDKENRNNLKDGIINGRKKYAKEFKEQFHGSYVGYLEDFPERKQLFENATKMICFITLAKLMLIQITEMFLQCASTSNKYAIFQMMWYSFTGKVLNLNCGINFIDNLITTYRLSMRQSNKALKDCDIHVQAYLSCFMKSLMDFFLHVSYKLKSNEPPLQRTAGKPVNVDSVSVYRIAGANLHCMIKKRKSSKFVSRLTKKHQKSIQSELYLLQQLHFSDEEKQKCQLPAGLKFLDRGSLLIVKKPIFNFTRLIIRRVCNCVNKESHKKLGLQMTRIAKLKFNDRESKSMFLACVKLASGNKSLQYEDVCNLFTELCNKVFNTLINEYVKRDKFMQKDTAQLMLRDKLKFFAAKPRKTKQQS